MKKTYNCKICGNLKDGKHQSYCKSCDKIRAKKYRKLNRNKIASARKNLYFKNKDKIISISKDYYLKNQDKRLFYGKDYYKKNKQKMIKQSINNKKKYQKKFGYTYLDSIRDKTRRKIDISFDKLCEICNKNKAVARHHLDYFYPLKVILVCNDCHGKIHRRINPLIIELNPLRRKK